MVLESGWDRWRQDELSHYGCLLSCDLIVRVLLNYFPPGLVDQELLSPYPETPSIPGRYMYQTLSRFDVSIR